MKIVNVMWAGGSPYSSVHKVHQQILSQAGKNSSITSWLLQGQGPCCSVGATHEWHLNPRLLKGRNLWRLLRPWLRVRLRRALERSGAGVLLLDGLGVARLVLPVLKDLPGLHTTLLFHGTSRLRDRDIALLRSVPADRLNIAAVSGTLAKALERVLDRPVQALRVALDPDAFIGNLRTCEESRRMLGLPQKPARVLGAVGRLVDSKGFDFLIEAFARAHERQPDLHLAILGEGELRPRLEARIQALGLAGHVQLCGHRQDLSQLYRAFDWLLVPSRSEGLGLVVQEAVMSGVPLICSDLQVFREQLGSSGHYLPVADLEAWSAAIEACGSGSGETLAQAQWQALAPEQAWTVFRERSSSLLQH